MADSTISQSWSATLKVISILLALGLIGLAAYSFYRFDDQDPIDVILPTYYV